MHNLNYILAGVSAAL